MKCEWKKYKLGEVCNISSSKRIFAKEYTKSGVPFYRGKEIIEKSLGNAVSTELFISQKRYEEIKSKFDVPQKGDILLTSVGTLGIPWLVDEENFYFKDGNLTWLRTKNGLLNAFLYLWLNSNAAEHQIDTMCIGSTQKALTIDTLRKFEISVPNIQTQEKICSILYPIMDKIELNNAINKNLQEQALALFKQQFIIEEFEGCKKSLYDFADYINGASFKPSECGKHGLPIVKIVELKNGITDSTKYFDGFKGEKYLVHDKDILFSWSGNPDTSIDIFIWAHGNAILNQHTFNVKSTTGNHWFTYLMLKYFKPEFSRIARNKQTTGLGHVTVNDLKSLKFIYNESVIQKFEQKVSPFMESVFLNIVENQRLTQLRNNLLPKLMSGEIDVSDINF